MEEEVAAPLEQFAKDATGHADSVSKKSEEMSLNEIEGWQVSMALLETMNLEMEVETVLVFAAQSRLEGSIEHLVEGDKKENNMLSKKADTIAMELAGLLEFLRLKEAEITENDACIQEVQERISVVVSKFHGSQSDIDLKLKTLQEA
ncbi:hypothetical protein GUJ93_ZPchr0002g25512 [Zizania palustris]|uniref:Uncharacterized protein n=1 Tax=Zizania palustris TaxID=103762 RepID=A0A8J5VW54_ZIZPA|nr:hypothetical protein GUJ93_ZPchr0002g25512 [Zizania palustris]